jgi:hypothetical protein
MPLSNAQLTTRIQLRFGIFICSLAASESEGKRQEVSSFKCQVFSKKMAIFFSPLKT